MRLIAETFILIISITVFQPTADAAPAPWQRCAYGKITQVLMGKDSDINKGQPSDGYNSIWIAVTDSANTITHQRLNSIFNLNDPQGAGFLAAILTAATLGATVELADHYGDPITCDDWDEIIVSF